MLIQELTQRNVWICWTVRISVDWHALTKPSPTSCRSISPDDNDYLYSFSTVGQKIEWMRANPNVCVETDEVTNSTTVAECRRLGSLRGVA